jgi:hypothetical protein
MKIKFTCANGDSFVADATDPITIVNRPMDDYITRAGYVYCDDIIRHDGMIKRIISHTPVEDEIRLELDEPHRLRRAQ